MLALRSACRVFAFARTCWEAFTSASDFWSAPAAPAVRTTTHARSASPGGRPKLCGVTRAPFLLETLMEFFTDRAPPKHREPAVADGREPRQLPRWERDTSSYAAPPVSPNSQSPAVSYRHSPAGPQPLCHPTALHPPSSVS